jgi:phage portal protein BeeE
VGLLEKVAETRLARSESIQVGSRRYSMDQYIAEFLNPGFTYGNTNYPLGLNQTMLGASKTKEIVNSLPAYSAAIRKSPPAFAAEMVRALVLSQARFCFRDLNYGTTTPRKIRTGSGLKPLERPWPNATTGELIARMEWHAGLAGNAFVTNFEPGRLRILRPDWTAIVYGSQREPDDPMGALDGEVIGYVYANGGFTNSDAIKNAKTLRVDEVAHWSPLPDPLSPGLGMSWLTPALRDIQGDNMMIEHKVKFYDNGATPNLVITGVPGVTPEQFNKWVDQFGDDHDGIRNAYRTMYLALGMDAKVVGSNLEELDFSSTGGYSETRISFLSRVPAALLGISAGLKGSSLNAGNYAETRRTFTDTWVYPTLQDLCKALAVLVDVPQYAELWFDTTDMPILRDDAQVVADVEKVKEETIVAYVNGGFTAESAIAAVRGQDISLLKHSGLVSVQLQPPGTVAAPPSEPSVASANGKPPAPNGGKPAMRSMDAMMPMPINIALTVPDPPVPPAPVFNNYVTVPERSVSVQNTVQPASAPEVTIQGDTINVAPAEVSVPVTVQPAEVSVPITVQPANAPEVKVDVNLPPAKGVTVERDKDGNVSGVTPK